MLARLTYGTDNAVGKNWQETETYPAKRAAQEAVLLSAILFRNEHHQREFIVSPQTPSMLMRGGCYFIRVELLEREKQLCRM